MLVLCFSISRIERGVLASEEGGGNKRSCADCDGDSQGGWTSGLLLAITHNEEHRGAHVSITQSRANLVSVNGEPTGYTFPLSLGDAIVHKALRPPRAVIQMFWFHDRSVTLQASAVRRLPGRLAQDMQPLPVSSL